jgi:hypothetical protein
MWQEAQLTLATGQTFAWGAAADMAGEWQARHLLS